MTSNDIKYTAFLPEWQGYKPWDLIGFSPVCDLKSRGLHPWKAQTSKILCICQFSVTAVTISPSAVRFVVTVKPSK